MENTKTVIQHNVFRLCHIPDCETLKRKQSWDKWRYFANIQFKAPNQPMNQPTHPPIDWPTN